MTNQIRTYKEQFEARDCEKIEEIFSLLETLKNSKRILRFYSEELKCCLQGGSILGGLLITFSIMEMFILENYVSRHYDEGSDKYAKAVYGLEKNRTHISDLLDESVNFDFLEKNDAETLKNIYKELRIPLAHGLRTKGLYSTGDELNNFIKAFFGEDFQPQPASWGDMENQIESEGLNTILTILKILIK